MHAATVAGLNIGADLTTDMVASAQAGNDKIETSSSSPDFTIRVSPRFDCRGSTISNSSSRNPKLKPPSCFVKVASVADVQVQQRVHLQVGADCLQPGDDARDLFGIVTSQKLHAATAAKTLGADARVE